MGHTIINGDVTTYWLAKKTDNSVIHYNKFLPYGQVSTGLDELIVYDTAEEFATVLVSYNIICDTNSMEYMFGDLSPALPLELQYQLDPTSIPESPPTTF